MPKNIFEEKKKIILFLSVLLILGFALSGCNWFGEGILNVFDPKAQIRLEYTQIDLAEGTISLEVYSLNQVEFIGEGFSYKYYNDGVLIPGLSRTVGATFYVSPSNSPGTAGAITEIDNMPLYFQEVIDYITMNPMITELTATITMIGTDGAGHSISKSLTVDLPAIQPGIDFIPPVAKILTEPSPPAGNIPLAVTFDGSQSCDQRNSNSECLTTGIKSFYWDLGDGSTSSSKVVTHTYDTPGTYVVTLTVTDYFDNQGIDTITVEAGDASGPTASIKTIPDPPDVAIGENITFDGTDSVVSGDCGAGGTIESYEWDFGDGNTDTGSIVTHSYSAGATYTVTLTVTDSNGKSAVTSVEVTVS